MVERKEAWFLPLFLSLLFHLLLMLGLSLNILLPKKVSATNPVRVRIVSIDLPKPKENLFFNPNSRLLSNANRRESGAGKLSSLPRLKRDTEDRFPTTRSKAVTEMPAPLSLPQISRVFPQLILPPAEEDLPKARTPQFDRKSPAETRLNEILSPDFKPVKQAVPRLGEKVNPVPKINEMLSPDFKPMKQAVPRLDEKVNPVPKLNEMLSPDFKPMKQAVPKMREKIKPAPRKRANQDSVKKPMGPTEKFVPELVSPRPKEKIAVPSRLEERPKLVEKIGKLKPQKIEEPARQVLNKRIDVASLPKRRKVRKRPEKNRLLPKRKPAIDRLAMFRPKPRVRVGRNAPNINLSDEDKAFIAKAGREEQMRAEEGESISLDTRDYRYASYFAHVKEKIKTNWNWRDLPREARNYGGSLQIKFVIRDDGLLHRVLLLKSSGHRILDDEALSAITEAAPFKAFPPGIKRKLLPIHGSFIYDIR